MKSNTEFVVTLLKYTFGLVPIVAGLDKFINILADWSQYISPVLTNMMPFDSSIFIMPVGVIEIVAGILVFTKTKMGALVVSIWLVAIAFSLLLSGHYFDIAVRDTVMAIAAFSLFKLKSQTIERTTN